MSKGTVAINFTIGFGNNLFQYAYAKLLAERHDLQLHHRAIPEVGVAQSVANINKQLNTVVVNDDNYKHVLYFENLENCNVVVSGYFEDYKILKPYLSDVREWFDKKEITNTNDVVLHLRLQNRLVQVSHNKNHITTDSFKTALSNFDYDRLHIVTDAEKWETHNLEDIEKIRHEIKIGPNPPSNSPWVEAEQSLEYMNHLIDGFSDLNPIVHCNEAETIEGSGGLRGGFIDDFNLLRSFNQVIVFNSTFSWWAATLSAAEKVVIFNPWKIAKPSAARRNLGSTKYPGWSSWGSVDDLYFKKYDIK